MDRDFRGRGQIWAAIFPTGGKAAGERNPGRGNLVASLFGFAGE